MLLEGGAPTKQTPSLLRGNPKNLKIASVPFVAIITKGWARTMVSK